MNVRRGLAFFRTFFHRYADQANGRQEIRTYRCAAKEVIGELGEFIAHGICHFFYLSSSPSAVIGGGKAKARSASLPNAGPTSHAQPKASMARTHPLLFRLRLPQGILISFFLSISFCNGDTTKGVTK
jgi:hypothetical protein